MYIPVIGLEIHVQAKTKSKMFCRCSSEYFNAEPNTFICPVCFGLPGALPVSNKVAIEKCIKLALALNCSINQETKFDRKNYFYPDIPKGYQISQYDQPIGYEGYVEIEIGADSRRIRIERVHMEEDTAKSMHLDSGDTVVDYNKSGVPLIEIVTKPDFQSTEEVLAFAKRLRQIVRYCEVSDAEMQKGQMRFELNISVRKPDQTELPKYKVEVKNIGSISVLEKVVNFEIERQSKEHEDGLEMKAQTRGIKGMTGETYFQRAKETADDYRYFPEPDIPPILITDDQIGTLKISLPELPHERKQRYLGYGLNPEQAEIFVEDVARGEWFDNINQKLKIKNQKWEKELAKWINGEVVGYLEKYKLSFDESKVSEDDLVLMLELLDSGKISAANMKSIIQELFEKGGLAQQIIDREGYASESTFDLESIAKEVIAQNEKIVADISKNPNAIKALVGQVMRLSKGKANPVEAENKLKEMLKL